MRRHYMNKTAVNNLPKLLGPVFAFILLCSCAKSGPGTTSVKTPSGNENPGTIVITPQHPLTTDDPYTQDPGNTGDIVIVTASAETAGVNTPVKTADPQKPLGIDPERLYSRSVILKDIDTGEILYSLSPDKSIYPASLTKIMTGLLAAELLSPDGKFEITEEAIEFANERGASTAGFEPGEVTDKASLLGGILMSSGAECSYTAAVNISGSEEAFAALMNKRAQELGLSGTHFVNSTGLHDDGHFTTVSDLLVLTESALNNKDFVRFFTLDTYKAFTEPERRYQLTLISTVFSALADYDFGQVRIIGGKTGYTRQAGLCLVTYAEYNGHRYVLVTAANEGNKDTEKYHFIDAAYIYRVLQEEKR